MEETTSPSLQPIVLIADDDPTMRHLICRVVAQCGTEALGVADGTAAVAAVASHGLGTIIAVFLDHQMPQLGGVEAARAIQAMAPTLPLIIMSGHLSPDERATLEGLRVQAVLDKPFGLDILRAELERCINNPQAVRQP